VGIAARLSDKQFNGHRLRRIPHPLDDLIDGVVDAYRKATPSQRQAMMSEMTTTAAGVLCGFAERLAAVAVRTRSIEHLHRALVAVGMSVEALEDDRDHLYPLAAVHHSAVILGFNFTTLVDSVARELPTVGLARLHAFDRREERDRSLQAFGLRTDGEGEDFRYR
jgi:hypothetical protein